MKQADLDQGVRSDGLTTAEREEFRQLRREIKQLKMEREILNRSCGLICAGERVYPRSGFEFMTANQAEFPVHLIFRTLGPRDNARYRLVIRR